MRAYEFLVEQGYGNKPKWVRHNGDYLVFPSTSGEGKQYFKVIIHPDNAPEHLVYAVAASSVDEVRTVDPNDPIEQLADEAPSRDDHNDVVATLSAAIRHLRDTLPRTDCGWVEGDVLQSGVRTCMIHQRAGSKPGECAVADANQFLEDFDLR